MRAWVVDSPAPIAERPLVRAELEVPEPGPFEVRVRVQACGVCRTDLHLAEGDLPPRHPRVVPGHEVIGVIDALGEGATRFSIGDRIGIAWLASSCGVCEFCVQGRENLCLHPRFTGWDLDGGYAEYAVVLEDFAYVIPPVLSAESAAPLLCAGIIGYRAFRQLGLSSGATLGIFGFGASAHLTAQIAIHAGLAVHVMTRSESARRLALELGASSAQDSGEPPPVALDGAILFAPSGSLVPVGLRTLRRGGTLAIAGVFLSDIPTLHYHEDLFYERKLQSITANTRVDGEELLALAREIPLVSTTTPYALEDADRALEDLAHGGVHGAAVLLTS